MIMANSGSLVNPPPPASSYNGNGATATANVASSTSSSTNSASQSISSSSSTTSTAATTSISSHRPPSSTAAAQPLPPSTNAKTPSPVTVAAPPPVTTAPSTSSSSSNQQAPAPQQRTGLLSNDQRWIFTLDKIQNSPSRLDHMSAEEEAHERLKAALFIHELGSKIKVNQLCVNTAMIYMHRFFMIHSFKKFHPNVRIVATACLFFACKVEEQPRRLREFIDAVHAVNRKPHDLAPHNSEEYRRYGDEIVVLESCILQTLGFNVLVNHAHTVIIKTCQMIKAPRDLAEAAYLTATNSLIISNFCVKFSSEKVACFCIYLACKWTGLKIPTSSEGMQWYQYVNPNINEQELEEITKEYLAIYEQVPEKVKRKLGKTKTNDEVDNQQQQQQVQKQKPPPAVDLNKTAPSALHHPSNAQKHHHSQNNPANSIHGPNQATAPPVHMKKQHPISSSTSSISVSNQSSSSIPPPSSSSATTPASNPVNKTNYNSHPPPNSHYPQHNSQQQQVKQSAVVASQQQPKPHNIAYSSSSSGSGVGGGGVNKSNAQQQQHRSNSNHHLSFNGADSNAEAGSESKPKMGQFSNSMSNLSAVKKPSSSSPFANGGGGAAPGFVKQQQQQQQQSPAKSSGSIKRGNEDLNNMPNKMPKFVNDAKTTS